MKSTIGRKTATLAKKIKSPSTYATTPDAAASSDLHAPLKVGRNLIKETKEDLPHKKAWNDMSHLSIKRFQDDDPQLRPGAKSNRAKFPYVAIAEMDPSGRSVCKLCGELIQPKGALRMGLMMECHKGYRVLCTLHATPCFWDHPETKKLTSVDEIYFHPNVADVSHKNMIAEEFIKLNLK
jgi:hypothetical protein